MNVDRRFTYEPAYLRFHKFLRASVLIARERFVQDGEKIKAEWKALRPGNFVPTDKLFEFENSFIVSQLMVRAPVLERMP